MRNRSAAVRSPRLVAAIDWQYRIVSRSRSAPAAGRSSSASSRVWAASSQVTMLKVTPSRSRGGAVVVAVGQQHSTARRIAGTAPRSRRGRAPRSLRVQGGGEDVPSSVEMSVLVSAISADRGAPDQTLGVDDGWHAWTSAGGECRSRRRAAPPPGRMPGRGRTRGMPDLHVDPAAAAARALRRRRASPRRSRSRSTRARAWSPPRSAASAAASSRGDRAARPAEDGGAGRRSAARREATPSSARAGRSSASATASSGPRGRGEMPGAAVVVRATRRVGQGSVCRRRLATGRARRRSPNGRGDAGTDVGPPDDAPASAGTTASRSRTDGRPRPAAVHRSARRPPPAATTGSLRERPDPREVVGLQPRPSGSGSSEEPAPMTGRDDSSAPRSVRASGLPPVATTMRSAPADRRRVDHGDAGEPARRSSSPSTDHRGRPSRTGARPPPGRAANSRTTPSA